MPALVIKDLPVELHRRLKKEAHEHHRSMTRHAVVLLEEGLHRVRSIPTVQAHQGRFALTNAFINQAKREGRA
jgi:plasmid stability protein